MSDGSTRESAGSESGTYRRVSVQVNHEHGGTTVEHEIDAFRLDGDLETVTVEGQAAGSTVGLTVDRQTASELGELLQEYAQADGEFTAEVTE